MNADIRPMLKVPAKSNIRIIFLREYFEKMRILPKRMTLIGAGIIKAKNIFKITRYMTLRFSTFGAYGNYMVGKWLSPYGIHRFLSYCYGVVRSTESPEYADFSGYDFNTKIGEANLDAGFEFKYFGPIFENLKFKEFQEKKEILVKMTGFGKSDKTVAEVSFPEDSLLEKVFI